MRVSERVFHEKNYLRNALFLTIGIALAMYIATHHLHFWEEQQAGALDLFMKYRSRTVSDRIKIVEIDEAAFRSEDIGETQPISRLYLSRVIRTLAEARPSLIAIDLDLSIFSDNQQDLILAIQDAARHTKIVLSYTILQEETEEGARFLVTREKKDFITGMERLAPNRIFSGYVNLQSDEGKVRRMRPVSLLADGMMKFSFPASVAAACGAKSSFREKEVLLNVQDCFGENLHLDFEWNEPERINFFQTFEHRSSGFVLNQSSATLETLFRGKIVLLGATFDKASDVWNTPLDGTAGVEYGMQGVTLLAHAVNTFVVKGKRIRPLGALATLAVDVVFGFLIALLLIYVHNPIVISFGILVGMGFFVTVGSFGVLSIWDNWLDYVATGNGLLIHRWIHTYHEKKKTQKTITSYRGRDLLDWLLKAVQAPSRKSVVLVAEVTNLLDLCKDQPELNAMELVKEWIRTGYEYQKKFPEASVFVDSRITAFFPCNDGVESRIRESLAFITKNVAALNSDRKNRIKRFQPLLIAFGIDVQARSMLETIGNASELAMEASRFYVDILTTGQFKDDWSDSSEWKFCGEIKTSQGKKIPIYGMKLSSHNDGSQEA